MRGQIPKDVRIAPYYDQSLMVRNSMNSVRDSILIGLLLSVVILFAFLRNWGTTFVAIPAETRCWLQRPQTENQTYTYKGDVRSKRVVSRTCSSAIGASLILVTTPR